MFVYFTGMRVQLIALLKHAFAYSVTCGVLHKLSLCFYFTVTCKVHVLYNLRCQDTS